MYDVGDVYPTSVQVRDADGAAADATAVVCTAVAPDGTTTTPPIEHTGPGAYAAGIPITMPGLWSVDWNATGLNASAYSDSFTARDPASVPVLSLADAKAYLNITSTDSDDELRTYLDVVTQKGEDFCGRVFGRRTIVADLPGSRWQRSLLLPIGPVLALAAVSGDGDAIDPATVTTSPDAAVLYREAGWDYNRISVTYLAGYRVQPATDVMGARMLLRWLWQSQRGTIRRTAENWAPGDGWDLPNAVVGQWRDSTLSGFG